MKVTLSLWDIGGQKRFDFFKTDFFKGTAAVGLVFDLTRPETFEEINTYFNDIREHSGNIPIILIGNKRDLKEQVGETINRSKIIDKVNRFNLLEYIETSALKNVNVEDVFRQLTVAALLDLRPRIGEIQQIENDTPRFRFKMILAGPAAVGKSSLIQCYTHLDFKENYKLTVGLDLLTRDIELEEKTLPRESIKIIRKALLKQEKRKIIRLERRTPENKSSRSQRAPKITENPGLFNPCTPSPKEKTKKGLFSKKGYTITIVTILIASIILVVIFL